MTVDSQSTAQRDTKSNEAARVDFAPIQPLRAHEYVAEQIRRHIALRFIRPGESLPPERELAKTFGVGRPTIQHAMRLLEADHLVEARRGRRGGTFVLEPTEDAQVMDELVARVRRDREALDEMLVFRRTLEPAVAHLAATTRRRSDLTAMRRTIRSMAQASAEPDYMRYDTEFHLSIAQATRNRFIEASTEQIRMNLNDAMSLLPESDAWHGRLSDEHDAVIAAIEKADPGSAYAAMDIHVANSERGIRAVLAAIRRRGYRIDVRLK